MPEELSQDDIDALMSGLGGEAASPVASPPATAGNRPFALPDFGATDSAAAEPASVDLLYDVDLEVKIELGRTQMTVDDVLRLREGSVVQLDKDAGAPVDILINGRLVAEGEVLVLNENFCVRVISILSNRERTIIKR